MKDGPGDLFLGAYSWTIGIGMSIISIYSNSSTIFHDIPIFHNIPILFDEYHVNIPWYSNIILIRTKQNGHGKHGSTTIQVVFYCPTIPLVCDGTPRSSGQARNFHLRSWPSQLYIWRRTCEQIMGKPENPILVMLYAGMMLPLFIGDLSLWRLKMIKSYGHNPQYLEDSLGFFQHCSCGLLRSTDHLNIAAVSDLHLPSSTRTIWYPSDPNGDGSRHIQHPFVHLCFCIFAGNVHKKPAILTWKAGDSMAENGQNWP